MGRCIELENRTADFSLRVVRLCRALPPSAEAQIISKQLLRAGTSVGANYRATQRARSKAEFISKLAIVIEEADEVLFWLDLLVRAEIVGSAKLDSLKKEANELVSIFVASQKTVRKTPFLPHSNISAGS